MSDLGAARRLQQTERAFGVVGETALRIGDRIHDAGHRGEMDDYVDARKAFAQCRTIEKIAVAEFHGGREVRRFLSDGEIIEYDDIVTQPRQMRNEVGADEAGAASDQYFHHPSPAPIYQRETQGIFVTSQRGAYLR